MAGEPAAAGRQAAGSRASGARWGAAGSSDADGGRGATDDDARWMRRALDLAERGRWTVSPNPLVGCVLVRDGAVVGEGWHSRAGGPHAEVAALEAAGERARGSTAYVTLEPCDHRGRTGPCSQALITAGVARVAAALPDPNPYAAGGSDTLRAAGVTVDVGLLADEARRQNAVFLHGLTTGRAFVTVKLALSLDGRIAAADGTSRWLTGPDARRRAHALRAEADAVAVGSGTVLADDPLLTVRLAGYEGPQPLRVVLDRRLRTRATHRVNDSSAPSLCAVGRGGDPAARTALTAAGVDVVELPDAADGGLAALLDALWARGVRSLLVEGGAGVAGAFLAARLVDRLVVHIAPLLLGDRGRPAVGGLPIGTLDDAPRWRVERLEHVGDDVVLTCLPCAGSRGDAVEHSSDAGVRPLASEGR